MTKLQQYKEKIKEKQQQLKSLEQIRQEDTDVDKVIQGINKLLNHVEQKKELSPDWLATAASKLSVRYARLLTTLAEKRTARDVARQSFDELESNMILEKRQTCETVTQAKAEARSDISNCSSELMKYESEYKHYKNIEKATDRILSIIQSVLKQKLQDEIKSNLQK